MEAIGIGVGDNNNINLFDVQAASSITYRKMLNGSSESVVSQHGLPHSEFSRRPTHELQVCCLTDNMRSQELQQRVDARLTHLYLEGDKRMT